MADKKKEAEKTPAASEPAQAAAPPAAQPAEAEAQSKPESGAGAEGAAKKSEPLKQPDPGKMIIKVYSPYQVYFDDQATSISAINDTGPFDILPKHHRFLTLLSPCELIIAADKGEEKIKISRGIMYVKEDRVTVFLDV